MVVNTSNVEWLLHTNVSTRIDFVGNILNTENSHQKKILTLNKQINFVKLRLF